MFLFLTLECHTVQRLMLSKGATRTISYLITVILQYCLDKTIARSRDMYRDYILYLGILSLVIKCFGITNTSAQNFAIRISSVKTVTKWLRKLKSFLNKFNKDICIIFIDFFTPCDSHFVKNISEIMWYRLKYIFCTFTWHEVLYSMNV